MSGLYNHIFGYNPATVLLAPMLTDEDPRKFFPRFRDCYSECGRIVIYTRVGGGNRSYSEFKPHEYIRDDDFPLDFDYGENKLYEMPTFYETWDDEFDSTYGYYAFDVPKEWEDDFKAVMEERLDDLSDAYVARVEKCFGRPRGTLLASIIADIDTSVGRLTKAPDWGGYLEMLERLGGCEDEQA